jgi:hypothetical protein
MPPTNDKLADKNVSLAQAFPEPGKPGSVPAMNDWRDYGERRVSFGMLNHRPDSVPGGVWAHNGRIKSLAGCRRFSFRLGLPTPFETF